MYNKAMKIRYSSLFKKLFLCLAAAGGAFALYALGAYLYTLHHVRPVTPLVPPSQTAPASSWRPNDISFVHQTNNRERLLKKSKKYNGFEIDTYTLPGEETVFVAHDLDQLKYKTTINTAFAMPQEAQNTYWWIDMKTLLTQSQIDQILRAARRFGIPQDHLIFEPRMDHEEQAMLLKKNGLNVILQIIGFYKENLDERQTAEKVAEIQRLIDRIQPLAISSGMGNYPYLKTYFPHYPKAICYNTTKRPSLKKRFMKRQMQKDPSVIMLLTDEYDWDN